MSTYSAEISGDMRFGPFRWHIVITETPGPGELDTEIARGVAWSRRGADRKARRMLRRASRIGAHQSHRWQVSP